MSRVGEVVPFFGAESGYGQLGVSVSPGLNFHVGLRDHTLWENYGHSTCTSVEISDLKKKAMCGNPASSFDSLPDWMQDKLGTGGQAVHDLMGRVVLTSGKFAGAATAGAISMKKQGEDMVGGERRFTWGDFGLNPANDPEPELEEEEELGWFSSGGPKVAVDFNPNLAQKAPGKWAGKWDKMKSLPGKGNKRFKKWDAKRKAKCEAKYGAPEVPTTMSVFSFEIGTCATEGCDNCENYLYCNGCKFASFDLTVGVVIDLLAIAANTDTTGVSKTIATAFQIVNYFLPEISYSMGCTTLLGGPSCVKKKKGCNEITTEDECKIAFAQVDGDDWGYRVTTSCQWRGSKCENTLSNDELKAIHGGKNGAGRLRALRN